MLFMLCFVFVMVLLVRDKVFFIFVFLGLCMFFEFCFWNCFLFGFLVMWVWNVFNLKKRLVFVWWLCFFCNIVFWMLLFVYNEKDVVKWN